jgi:hypothetical protein
MGMESGGFSFSTGQAAESAKAEREKNAADNERQQKSAQENALKEKFNNIKIGDSVSYKNSSGELEDLVVVSKDEESGAMKLGPSPENTNPNYSYGTTIGVEDMDKVIDFFTPQNR